MHPRVRGSTGLRAGRVRVTNGPLLRTRVEGEPPGHVFQLDAGERREFQIALDLAFYSATQIEYLEIVQNGVAIHHVRLDELAKQKAELPAGEFRLQRLVSGAGRHQQPRTFTSSRPPGRTTSKSNYQPRISRASVQYFLDWLDEAANKFAGNAAVRRRDRRGAAVLAGAGRAATVD